MNITNSNDFQLGNSIIIISRPGKVLEHFYISKSFDIYIYIICMSLRLA